MTFWLFLTIFAIIGLFWPLFVHFGLFWPFEATFGYYENDHFWPHLVFRPFLNKFSAVCLHFSCRLVVWRYAKSSANKPFSANCRELTLPPSDLAHNAKLVNVFATNQNQTPSCIAVSPEGKFIFQCCQHTEIT